MSALAYADDPGLDFANGLYSRKMYAPATSEYEKFIQTNPGSQDLATARFRAADCYYFLKKYSDAVFYFRAFLQDFPKDARVTLAEYRLGSSQFHLKNWGESAARFTKLAHRAEDTGVRSGSLFYLAKIREAQGHPGFGLKILKRLLKSYASSEYAAYAGLAIGDNWAKLKNDAEALRAYRQAAEPPAALEIRKEAALKIAGIHFRSGNLKSARAYYEKVLATPADSKTRFEEFKKSALLGLSQISFLENDFAGALSFLDRIIPATDWPLADQYYLQKTSVLEALGRYPEALENARTLIERFPQSELLDEARYKKALFEMAEPGISIAALENFVHSYPQSAFLDIAHYKLGVALTAENRPEEALAHFETVIQKFPDSQVFPESLFGAAVYYEQTGNAEKAIAFYERLVQNHPDHFLIRDTLERLGYLYMQTEHYPKASALYQDILLKHPDWDVESGIALWLVRFWVDERQLEKAQQVLAVFPERYPKENLTHEITFFKAECALGLGDFAKASELYADAIAQSPEGLYVPYAHLGRGIAYAAQDDSPNAAAEFKETLRYDSDTKIGVRARFELANLELKSGNLLEAAKAFMLVAILYDDEKYGSAALYKAGECFTASQKPDEAQKAWNELKIRYPKSAWALKLKTS